MTESINRVPFPHILTQPKYSNKFLLRFVTPVEIMEGELIFEHSHMQENLWSREFEPVYHVYLVKTIMESRAARGEWTAYEQWPNYYSCTGEYIGLRFKSALNEPV